MERQMRQYEKEVRDSYRASARETSYGGAGSRAYGVTGGGDE